MRIIILCRIFIVLVPVLVAGYLLNARYVFSPITFHWRPGQYSQLIRQENDAVVKDSGWKSPWRLANEKMVSSFRVFRYPKELWLRYSLSNIPNDATVALTVKSPAGQGTITKFIQSAILDNLSWNHQSLDGITVWQNASNKQHSTLFDIQASLSNVPRRAIELIGLHPYSLFTLPSYQRSSTDFILPVAIQGSTTLNVFSEAETIRFEFDIVDRNLKNGRDPVTIRIAPAHDIRDSGKRWSKSQMTPDDGITTPQKITSPARHVSFDYPVLQGGVYVVAIETSEDILITNFSSSQKELQFERSAALVGSALDSFGAESSEIKIQTRGQAKFNLLNDRPQQTILYNNKKNLLTSKKPLQFSNTLATAELKIPKTDIHVYSSGGFAVAPFTILPDSGAFSPARVQHPGEGIQYVIADYVPQKSTARDWQKFAFSDFHVDGDGRINYSLTIDSAGDIGGVQIQSMSIREIPKPINIRGVWKKLVKIVFPE